MILNTFVAVCAGFVLNIMFGSVPKAVNPEKLIPAFAGKLEKVLFKFYENSDEARRMAGGVLAFFTLVVFAGVPLVLLIVGYKILPVIGLVLDCFFCWSAFSVRSIRGELSKIFRGVRSGNLKKAQQSLTLLTGEDCMGLDRDEIIKKAVECASDGACDEGAGALFWSAVAGGFGGMFYRCLSVLNKNMNEKKEKYAQFGKAVRKLWEIFDFLPALICSLVMRLDVKFLKLNSENCSKVYKSDRRKQERLNLGYCRSVMAGAIGISLTEETYTEDGAVKLRHIGEQLKDCEQNDVYWANQLMYGAVFGCLVLFSVIRLAVYFIV